MVEEGADHERLVQPVVELGEELRLGYRIKIIPGSRNNIKITTKDDLLIAETLIKNKQYDEN